MRRTVTVLLVVIATLVTACGNDGAPEPGLVRDEPLEHIHGVGRTSDDAVFVATHNGLFRAGAGSATLERVGDRRKDLMGFAALDDRRFIASGHPDRRDDLPPHMGVVSSDDGGGTWKPLALTGEVDFHVMRASGDRVYAFDSLQSRFMLSDDGGRTWRSRGAGPTLFDAAIDPDDPDRVVVATEEGLYVSATAGREWRRASARAMGLLAWHPAEGAVVIDARGVVLHGGRRLRRWRAVGSLGVPVVALSASGGALVAATEDGDVIESLDAGRTWEHRAGA
jgi:hypothetical protein